ncbi:tetratricopeptide repeat protein [Sphingobacterium bovistauri]|uniref:Tetratricopeptide repeat-containing protein n=1 Tax=Sphingobacterium bovistauri TaxID=2781959 RepID=A0ABS7Z6Y3_9SPHI|nr:hypothetical protein [Sphingobacterium bovistauri]MCA5005923.1 hypothetical protein [Sphingobacterium bovistauri]
MNTRFRLVILVFAVIALAYCVVSGYYYTCVYILGLIGYMVWSQYRDGTVFLATQAFHKQDYEKTKRLLSEIKNPDHLRKGRRNFYEFMIGNIALKDNNIEEAEYHFQLASRLPWRKDNEKAMVLINLANINLRKKEYDRTEVYLGVVEKLKLTERQKDIVQKIKSETEKHKN